MTLYVRMLGVWLCLIPALAMPSGSQEAIAEVGDQTITLHDVDVLIDSSSVIGVPIPPKGTAERNRLRMVILDRMISANLLYLDALSQGLDDNPVYREDVRRYREAMLASLAREKLIGEIEIGDEEVLAYYKSHFDPDTPLTRDLGTAIRAKLRKREFVRRRSEMRDRLRHKVKVEIRAQKLDDGLGDKEVVARIDGKPLLWGEVRRSVMSEPGEKRREALEKAIDYRLLIDYARRHDLERDARYLGRLGEYRKTRLINFHRERLASGWMPSDEEIQAYFERHREKIEVKPRRKVQMVVVKTRQEAENLKRRIEAGELTLYQAAQRYSIDPNAKRNLGEIGWVTQGSGYLALDRLTFELNPGVIGGPVATPAGWHLVKVLETRPGRYHSLDDPATRRQVKRLLEHQREGRYVAALRKEKFPVVVHRQRLKQLLAREQVALGTH